MNSETNSTTKKGLDKTGNKFHFKDIIVTSKDIRA